MPCCISFCVIFFVLLRQCQLVAAAAFYIRSLKIKAFWPPSIASCVLLSLRFFSFHFFLIEFNRYFSIACDLFYSYLLAVKICNSFCWDFFLSFLLNQLKCVHCVAYHLQSVSGLLICSWSVFTWITLHCTPRNSTDARYLMFTTGRKVRLVFFLLLL